MSMSEAAKKAKREYARKWREQNREHILEYHKQWRDNNVDKVKAAQARYWERKAKEEQA